MVQIRGRAAAFRRGKELPLGPSPLSPLGNKHFVLWRGGQQALLPLGTLVKTYCSREREWITEKTQLYSLRRDKVASRVHHNSWAREGEQEGHSPEIWEHGARRRLRLHQNRGGIPSSPSPPNAKLRSLKWEVTAKYCWKRTRRRIECVEHPLWGIAQRKHLKLERNKHFSYNPTPTPNKKRLYRNLKALVLWW